MFGGLMFVHLRAPGRAEIQALGRLRPLGRSPGRKGTVSARRARPEQSSIVETVNEDACPQERHCATAAPSASVSTRNVLEWQCVHWYFMAPSPVPKRPRAAALHQHHRMGNGSRAGIRVLGEVREAVVPRRHTPFCTRWDAFERARLTDVVRASITGLMRRQAIFVLGVLGLLALFGSTSLSQQSFLPMRVRRT